MLLLWSWVLPVLLLAGLVWDDKAEKVGERDYEGVPYSVIQEYEVGIFKRKLYISFGFRTLRKGYIPVLHGLVRR